MKHKTRNKMGLLGLLGFLGLLGLATQNVGFYGFFGFFGFFGFSRIIPDEMFELNMNKAAKNAFMAGLMIVFPVVAVLGQFTSLPLLYNWGFAANFAIQLLVFTFSLYWYETKGGN